MTDHDPEGRQSFFAIGLAEGVRSVQPPTPTPSREAEIRQAYGQHAGDEYQRGFEAGVAQVAWAERGDQ